MGYIPYTIAERKGELINPTICHFYGIIIVMYLRNKEHNPPHVHAITQDFDAPFLIATGEIMEGEFPPKAGISREKTEPTGERLPKRRTAPGRS